MNTQQRIQQRANEIDAQVSRLAIRGVRACASIALRMRADVIRAYRNGDAPLAAMRKHYPAIAKVLTEGMSAAHGRGAVDALKVADMRVGRIKLDRQTDPYKNDIDFLKARLLLTDTEVASLARAYTAEALSVTGDIGSILDRRIGGVLSKSFSEGLHVKDGVEALRQEFDAAGITVQKPYLLETTFRTQMALAHAAGRANANADPAVQEILWGFCYTTVGDDRVRPTHAAMDGVTRPKDDPIWDTWTCPCGFNCRCTLVEVFYDDPAEMKTGPKPPTRILVDGAEVEVKPDAGWDFNPGDVYGDILNITAPVGGGAYRGVHV